MTRLRKENVALNMPGPEDEHCSNDPANNAMKQTCLLGNMTPIKDLL